MGDWMCTFDHLMVFKIGIAGNPSERYRCREIGYVKEKIWLGMDLLFEGPAELCRQLEKTLLRSCQQIPGCYNIRPGGEGVAAGSMHRCFCYIVFAPVGDGIPLYRARALRIKALQEAAGPK